MYVKLDREYILPESNEQYFAFLISNSKLFIELNKLNSCILNSIYLFV